MNSGLLIRLLLCIFTLGFFVYHFIDQQNRVILLKMQIPALTKELSLIKEKNTVLRFEVEQFESPKNLFKILQNKKYSHLSHPLEKDVIVVKVKG